MKLKLWFFTFILLTLSIGHAQTILFSEDFEDELLGDITGTSTEGIAWSATCPFCASGDIFEVNNGFGSIQGLRGNDTNGPADFVASGIDATGMHIIILEFDYVSNGYTGSGNLECNGECGGCSGSPADILSGSCNNCWDFLLWNLSTGTFTDESVVLGTDCSVLDNDHVVSDPGCSSPYDGNGNLIPGNDPANLTITISMAMWATAENMVIDNIVVTGYTKTEAIAAGLLASAGTDNAIDICGGSGTINLFDNLLGSPDNGGAWSGPSATTGGDLGTLNLASFNTGDYEYVVSTGSACQDTAIITVNSTGGAPMASVSGVQDICIGETITITASGGLSYEWSDNSTEDTLAITTVGNYFMVADNGCGTDTAFFSIASLGSLPSSSVSGVQDICTGETITVTGSGSGSFEWSDNSTAATLDISTSGSYFLAVTNSCGADTTFFTVNSLGNGPSASVLGNQDICTGETITVTASGGTTYEWSDGSTQGTLDINSAASYYVIAINNCGTDTAFFSIANLGTAPTAVLSGLQGLCSSNETATLSVTGGDNYLWSNASTSTSETFSMGAVGYVVAYNGCGNDTAYYSISDESVVADFSMNPSSGYEPLEVQFTNTSSNADAYSWDFGNGASSTSENTNTIFEDPGLYTVTLISSNSFGCSDTTTDFVLVNALPEIIVPNVFTPNADGVNNQFAISHGLISSIKGSVYNRWGQLVFEMQDQNFAWDGHEMDGDPSSEGTYFYILEITYINGVEESFSGTVMLIR